MMDGGSTVMPIVYPEISLTEICDILETAENVLILTHVNPDGDTIGSAYALQCLVEAIGGRARVICPSPIQHRLAFLMHGDGDPAWSADETDSAADTYDVICSVDVASPMQLGELGCLLSVVDFMIDHHGTGEPFAPHWIDEHASACGEMLYDIYCELSSRGHFEVHPEAARRIYAAIVSDTGSFKFSNTTTKTHLIAAGLVDVINTAADGGMDTAAVCRSLFGQRTLREMQAQALAITNLLLFCGGRLGVVLFTAEMLAAAGLTEEDIGNAVDTPRSLEGVQIGLSIRQLGDTNTYKVSSRANGDYDCAAVCAAFGGGGHTRAAGCTIEADTPADAVALVVTAFSSALE